VNILDKPVATTLDANVCIKHALYLGSFNGRLLKDSFCLPCRGFVNGCLKEQIPIGCFKSEIDHSYWNLTSAVNNMGGDWKGLGYYEREKIKQKAKLNMDHLFQKIALFEEKYSDDEIKQAEAFFRNHKKDLAPFLVPGSTKDPIPEEHDLILLVCANNLGYSCVHIVSDDTHFVAYSNEIPTAYNVAVIAMKNLIQVLGGWSWPIPN
jgi:hypothetical protein